MVGQNANKSFIKQCVENNSFPRFVIVTGERGSGKKTMAKYIAKQLKAYEIYPGNSVEAVREAIENSYKCAGTTAYIFPDADKMSIQAKNAMLKITEEPPRQAYFIMTVESMNNTLSTLKSRGTEIQMECYGTLELEQLIDEPNDNDKLALAIATTPGQLEQLRSLNVTEFYAFCEKVLDNVATVTGVNAFKIGNNFKFKDDGEGYDPVLFFECVKTICLRRCNPGIQADYGKALIDTIVATSNSQRELSLTGVKKDSTFDMWILKMRDIWKDVE